MYDHQLRVYGEYLAKEQTLPKNAEAVGNGGGQRTGSLLGGAEIVVRASSAATIAAGRSLSLYLEESADNTVFTRMPISFKRTAGSGGLAFAVSAVMGRIPLPSDAGRYVRLVVATDDTAASGSFDAGFDYLPR